MPAVINEVITQRSWEFVKIRIAQIIKEELFNQAAISYNNWLDCDVYTERWSPVTPDECIDHSVVNISIDSITKTNETAIDSDVLISFGIVINTSMFANENGGSDTNSSERNQIVTGVIEGILMHPSYIRLLFPAPFIMRRRVSEIKFGTSNREESMGMTLSMITFEVLCSQDEPLENGVPFGGSFTSVKVNETEKGYKYQI